MQSNFESIEFQIDLSLSALFNMKLIICFQVRKFMSLRYATKRQDSNDVPIVRIDA